MQVLDVDYMTSRNWDDSNSLYSQCFHNISCRDPCDSARQSRNVGRELGSTYIDKFHINTLVQNVEDVINNTCAHRKSTHQWNSIEQYQLDTEQLTSAFSPLRADDAYCVTIQVHTPRMTHVLHHDMFGSITVFHSPLFCCGLHALWLG